MFIAWYLECFFGRSHLCIGPEQRSRNICVRYIMREGCLVFWSPRLYVGIAIYFFRLLGVGHDKMLCSYMPSKCRSGTDFVIEPLSLVLVG